MFYVIQYLEAEIIHGHLHTIDGVETFEPGQKTPSSDFEGDLHERFEAGEQLIKLACT